MIKEKKAKNQKQMTKEQDHNLLPHEGVPTVFNISRVLAQEVTAGLRQERMTLGQLELLKLQKINRVLDHPELGRMIDEGKLTLGIIKPHANEGKGLPDSDQKAAEVLREEIGEENIVFSFSTQLSDQNVEDFYAAIKPGYLNQQSEVEGRTVWELIFEFSKSGPLTFILLYREQGDAVSWWREKMGKTKSNEADPVSIRGRHAILEKLPNNLVHGSDSIQSVHREIGALKIITRELATKAEDAKRLLPREETIREYGIVPPEFEILAIEPMQVIVYSPDKGVQRISF